MKTLPLIAIGLATLCAAVPGGARTPVSVAAFDSINLEGGGHVLVRHGPRQSVTLVNGNLETTRFSVRSDGTLEIRACVRSCRNYRLEVEIVTPELEGVGVEGGGEIRAEGAFPDRAYDSPGVWGDAAVIREVLARDANPAAVQ